MIIKHLSESAVVIVSKNSYTVIKRIGTSISEKVVGIFHYDTTNKIMDSL